MKSLTAVTPSKIIESKSQNVHSHCHTIARNATKFREIRMKHLGGEDHTTI